MYDSDEQLGFLPLAHVAGRMFYTFCSIESGCVVNLVEAPETFIQDQQGSGGPTVAFAVPRVWEKQHSTISIKLKDGTALGRFAYNRAMRLGLARAGYAKAGQPVPWPLRLACAAADFLVFKNIRIFLGIDRARWLSHRRRAHRTGADRLVLGP